MQAIIYDLQQAYSGIMKRLNWSWQTVRWGREKHYGTSSFNFYTLPIAFEFDQPPRSEKLKKVKFNRIHRLHSLPSYTLITVIGHTHITGEEEGLSGHLINYLVLSGPGLRYIVYGSRAEFIGINIFIIIKEQQCIETTS